MEEENMQEALEYFASMGLPMKNGLIDVQSLTDEQIDLLKKWKSETSIHGIIMPKIEDFYRSVFVAISTHPQKTEDGKINYLFGKGIGVEIALRGEISGRKQFCTKPIYRSHSDFELYNTKENPYSDIFQEIFGSQEFYPESATKGLKNIPNGYMDSTYETVIVDGYEILVPQLEILFLDKFLKKEGTPRDGVYDCELLAREYELDFELIKEYLEKYYFSYEEQKQRNTEKEYKENFASRLSRNLTNEFDDNENIELTVNEWNNKVIQMASISKNVQISGIKADMYIPISEEDVDVNENGEVVISRDYISRTIELISDSTDKKIKNERIETLTELEELFRRVKEGRTEKLLTISDFEEMAYDEHTIGTIEKVEKATKNMEKENISTNEKGGNSLEND